MGAAILPFLGSVVAPVAAAVGGSVLGAKLGGSVANSNPTSFNVGDPLGVGSTSAAAPQIAPTPQAPVAAVDSQPSGPTQSSAPLISDNVNATEASTAAQLRARRRLAQSNQLSLFNLSDSSSNTLNTNLFGGQ